MDVQRTTVDLPAALHRALRMHCLEHGVSMRSAIEAAVRAWLDGQHTFSRVIDMGDRQHG